MESDSDDDLAGYAPSGLSQSSNKPNSASQSKNEVLDYVKEEEHLTTPHRETLRRGEFRSSKVKEGGLVAISYGCSSYVLLRNSSAQCFIQNLHVPSEISSTSQLAWHKYNWKKSEYLNPVRIGSKDMIIGLNVQQDFDESKKYAVEYLSCLKGYTGKRNVVPKSQVLPYGELNEWNPELMKQYLGKLDKDDNVTALERQKEELYLQKVVKVASERQISGHDPGEGATRCIVSFRNGC
jgi:hypothetical protein